MAKIKKSVSVLLAVSMVFSMFTVVTLTASAEETDDLTYHNGDNVYVGDLNIGDVVDKGVILRSWSSLDQTHYSSFRVECDGVYWTDGGNTVTEFTTDRSAVLTSASDSENYVSPTKIYKERNLSFRSVFRSWAELKETVESVSDGSRQYIIDYDLTALDTDRAITIPSGASVTIDLNGHTLDRGLTSLVKDGGSAFCVPSGASLTITDSSEAHSGVITGATAITAAVSKTTER